MWNMLVFVVFLDQNSRQSKKHNAETKPTEKKPNVKKQPKSFNIP